MRIVFKIFGCIILAAILNWGSFYLSSNFLHDYVTTNLINLLVTLLAICIAQISILLPQITKIKEKHGIDFTKTISSLKTAIIEQISIIGVSILTLVLERSPHLQKCICIILSFDTILTASFIYAIYILWDTFKAITEVSEI